MKSVSVVLASALVTFAGPFAAFAASPILVDQPSARFADTALGNGNVLTLTYSNASNANQTITNITLLGASPGDFVVMPVGTLPATLAPGGTLKAAVAFNPTKIGLRSATVSASVMGAQTSDAAVAGQATSAAISAAPSPLQFGGTALGLQIKKSVSFTNSTMNQVTITGFAVTTNNAEFTASSIFNFPAQVPPGATLPIDVSFSPQGSGIRYGVLSLTILNANNPSNVVLIGSSGDPQVNLGNNGVLFGNTHVGAVSAPQMIAIGNIGYTDLKVLQIIIAGNNAGDFAAALPMLPASVPPGGSLMCGLVFKPMAAGGRTATVTVITDDPNNGALSVVVGGTGVVFMQTITPPRGTPLDFGEVKTGSTSQPLSVQVMNSSMAPLTITKVFISGPQASAFVLSLPPMGAVEVKAGGTTGFPLTFKPKAGGISVATLNLMLDDPNTPVLTVALQGIGTAGAVTVSPLAIDFGPVPIGKTTSKKTITVTNGGSAPLAIASVALTGADIAAFTLAGAPDMPTMLDPMMSLSFTVVFVPIAHAAVTANITITSDDPQAPTTNVLLKGFGSQPRLTITPMSLDFGVTVAGVTTEPQNVAITNSGDDEIGIDTVQVNGPGASSFKLEGFSGPTRIQPMEQIVVSVRFAPITGGNITASLSINPSAQALPPIAVSLKGGSVTNAVTITPSTNDFDVVDIGGSSDPVTFTVTNTSGGTLALAPITSTNEAFVVDTSATMFTLPPSAKTSFSVTFTPTVAQHEMGMAKLSLLTAPMIIIGKATFTGEGTTANPIGMRTGSTCTVGRGPSASGPASLASAPLLLAAAALLLLRRRRRA